MKVETSSILSNFFILLKDSIFGLVVLFWGLSFWFIPNILNEKTLELLFLSFSPKVLIFAFTSAGVIYITTRFIPSNVIKAFANIYLSLIFLVVMLTHMYISIQLVAWVALAAIVVYLVINAFQYMKWR